MRLIDADELKKPLVDWLNWYSGPEAVKGIVREIVEGIDNAPTIEAEPVWISVQDRLPEQYKDVLVIVRNNGALFTIIAYLTIGGIWVHKGFGRVIGVVHHWMPLPEPKKEDKHE